MSRILNALNSIQTKRASDRESLMIFSKVLKHELKKLDRKLNHVAASLNLMLHGTMV